MPAVLVEVGFINNDKDNALFDERFDEIAQGIAYAILGTLEEEEVEKPPAGEPVLYRVQVGMFREKQYADNLLYELQDQGFPAYILNEDGFYKVQVGAYQYLANAVRMEQTLRRAGYSTWITT